MSDSAPESQETQQPVKVEVDASEALTCYANFCRITGTPEELLIDFGFHPPTIDEPTRPIELTERIVTGWHTAKRLLHALQLTVQHHEAAFGVLGEQERGDVNSPRQGK